MRTISTDNPLNNDRVIHRGRPWRWGWSRDKTRRFIRDIESGGDYYPTGKKTGSHTGKKQAIRYVFNKLESKQNRGKNREVYNQHDTIIEPYDPLSFNPKTKKGIFQKNEKSLPPISFQNFIKENKKTLLDREEEIKSIAYFLDKYKATQHDQHPHLRPDQWQEAIEGIFIVELEHNQSDDLNREDCITIGQKSKSEVLILNFINQKQVMKRPDIHFVHS